MAYIPPKKILKNYAKVLVNFAAGKGEGIKKGETVLVQTSEIAKPLLAELAKEIWEKGGNIVLRYSPSNDTVFSFNREFYIRASEDQLTFFPEKLMKGQIDSIDHLISISAETNMHALRGIDPKKFMLSGKAMKQYTDWCFEKENRGKFSWTVGLYGTEAMALEARMSQEEYWEQIAHACYLDKKDPIKEWKKVSKQIENYQKKLTDLKIERVHVVGTDVDLWITIGKQRKWVSGGGANIPSFEIFTSPDWRGTNGWILFNQPLYRYGNLIEGIKLQFSDGKVVKSSATKNEKVLKAMIATDGADKIGEFSLTDNRFSRITKFMAQTLYDENIGGTNGNTHIALGNAYPECFAGDPVKLGKRGFEKLGFNTSSVHTDIISTSPRTVTAILQNGEEKVIYRNGQFTL